MKQHNFKLDEETIRLLQGLRDTDLNCSMSSVIREAVRLMAESRGMK